MRVKSYLPAASLCCTCCTFPFIAQGIDLDEKKIHPEPPKAALRSVAPVIVETEFGTLNLSFISSQGEVYICLQEVTGAVKYSQQVDTSMQSQAVLVAPSGTYILTIFDTTGNVIHQESNVIP